MNVYLVRHHTKKTILGLFWNENAKDLWWEIDGIADPGLYEYTALRHGSLHFPDIEPNPKQIPNDPNEAGAFDPDFSWGKAQASELLCAALFNATSVRWKKLPYADEEGGGVHQVMTEAGRAA